MFLYFLASTFALTTVLFPNRKYMLFVLLSLAIICGARDGVLGYDFVVYKSYFDNILSDRNIYNYEIGYFWLNNIFHMGGLSFHILLFFISFFFHFSLFVILFKLKDKVGINPGWVLFFYVTSGFYFWHSYTLLRQSIAISIFYLSISLSLNRGIAFNFAGLFFHFSSIINIFVIGFLKIKENISFRKVVIIFVFLLFLGAMLIEYSKEKFQVYEVSNTANYFVLIETLIQGLLLIFLLKENKLSFLIKVVVGVSILFCVLGVLVNEVFIRFLEPYKILMFMSYAVLLTRIRRNNRNLYISIAVLFIVLSYLRQYRFFDNFGSYAIPYMSIFHKYL